MKNAREWVRQCYFACRNHTFSSLLSQNQFWAVQRCQSSIWRNAVPWRVCHHMPRASMSPYPKDLSRLCPHLGTKHKPPLSCRRCLPRCKAEAGVSASYGNRGLTGGYWCRNTSIEWVSTKGNVSKQDPACTTILPPRINIYIHP